MDSNMQSFNKLKRDIETAQLLSFLLPKDQRTKIGELSNRLAEVESTVIHFNDRFTELGWCAYDSMSLPLMKEAVDAYETLGASAGEEVLLKYYCDDVKDIIHVLKNKAAPFAQRYGLIQHAFDDHFAERYYASIPLFLIIIDGSVNDYTKSKGFFAEGTELTAWDCLVGCSDGLSKIKTLFNKGRNKTNLEEIRIPYRNGILHGRDLNYDNPFVSCKCVALMFALADWMSMRDSEEKRKTAFEKECNPPPISESLKRIKENSANREEMSKWKPRTVTIGQDIPAVPTIEDCSDYQYVIPVIETFNAWKAKNYGVLSIHLANLFNYEKSEKRCAGECRKMFSSKEFCSFEIKEIEERGCAMTRILVQADWEVNGKHYSEPLEFGCAYQDEEGKTVLPWHGNGKWVLIPWKVQPLYKL